MTGKVYTYTTWRVVKQNDQMDILSFFERKDEKEEFREFRDVVGDKEG